MGTEERETLTETLESAVEAQENGARVCVPKMGTEERETLSETLESAVEAWANGARVSVPKMGTEEAETLTETLESAVQAQENGARVSVDSVKGVKDDVYVGGDGGIVIESRVVETEICVEKSFVLTNGGDGGFIGDAKETGGAAVEGLSNGDSTLMNGDDSYEEMGLNQNGVSVGVEVHGSLDSVNEKGENCGYVDNKGSVAENEGTPGEEVMKIPGSEGNGKFNAGHNEEENNGEGEEDAGDEEHEYSVGDFVWGKIRSHPWWPGRIYDPTDASEYARKYSQGGKLLVAYFGDESFSWCSPSQLKPFAEDFEEMSGQSNSKSFVNAVQNAVDEIRKLVEFKMTCYCISDKDRVGFERDVAMNAGIKEGVLVPDCDVNKLLIFLNGQSELLSTLRSIAKGVSNTSLPEFTVLRNCLAAFYRAKGGHKLPLFYEPVSIEGLEDKSRNVGVTDVKDFSGVVQVPFGGPVEEVWISSPMHPGLGQADQSLLQKCLGLMDDKLYERRKKKAVAELIEEDMVVKPDNEMGSFKDVTTPGKLVKTSGKEKGKSSDEVVSQDGVDLSSPSGKKRGRRKRSETEGSVKSQENKVRRAKNGGGEGEEESKDGVSSVGNEDTDAKEETEMGLASGIKRGRKKRVETQESAEMKVPRQKNGGGGKEGIKKEGGVSSIGNEDMNAKEETEKGLVSVRKRARRKKAETQGSEKPAEKEVESAKNGDAEGDNSLSVGKDDSIPKEETEKGLASRERKKSRYLSPPFAGLKKGGRNSSTKDSLDAEFEKIAKVARVGERMISAAGQIIGSPSFTSLKRGVRNSSIEKDSVDAESEKIAKVARIGERMISAAGQLIGSPPVVNCSDETKVDSVAISTPNPPREDQKKIIDTVKLNADTKEVVIEVRSAATNPLQLKEKSAVDIFLEFISEFRSALYLNGSKYKIFHRGQPGRKRKLLSSGHDTQSPESKTPRKRNAKKEQELSGVKKLEKDGGELRKKRKKEKVDNKKKGEAATMPVTLMVTFPSGFSLPSRNDLKAVFSKFGALNEKETEVLYNCSCAMVVFVKSSDAEEAFNASIKESPFGPAKVSYRLRYSLDGYEKVASPSSKERGENPVDDASQVLFTVKEKLELMTLMLEKSDGNMLPEDQSKLEVEMKGLLEVVNTVT
ncbi:hypothetical protein RHSIM_Rhsim08G0053500 [Rhododendron simsii]|uniref:PWWP domain-containing protein n=1 Tax=Rhododendron simsii TaxID=118357 RepID=A0A834GPA9_RHOSS|nr:hypothetical protein RHSIM_Rhsim08G0053500 [Rhododendron simsii]